MSHVCFIDLNLSIIEEIFQDYRVHRDEIHSKERLMVHLYVLSQIAERYNNLEDNDPQAIQFTWALEKVIFSCSLINIFFHLKLHLEIHCQKYIELEYLFNPLDFLFSYMYMNMHIWVIFYCVNHSHLHANVGHPPSLFEFCNLLQN